MYKEITVSYNRTINLGNYESAKIQTSLTQEIPGADPRKNREIFDALFVECEQFVDDKIQEEITKCLKK